MTKISYFDIGTNEAWAVYEFHGADAKCIACFTTEHEAVEELNNLSERHPKARLIHFLSEDNNEI
jgi:uncharacterized protein YqhQ